MKILLLTHKLPVNLHDGYNLHNFHYVSRLADEHEFHLVSLGQGELRPELAECFASVAVIPARAPFAGGGPFRRVAHAFSVDEFYDFDPAVLTVIREVLDREAIDVVWTSGTKMLVYSHRIEGVPVLGDIADEEVGEALEDLRRARGPVQAATRLKNLANVWRFQRKYLEHARICTVVSEDDQAMLARNCRGLAVRVIPNGVDGDYYERQGQPEDFPSLVFEGAMSHPPNVDGILWFCREALPLIHARRPEVKMLVVGKDPGPAVIGMVGPKIEVTGYVDDVRPWVDRSTIFVCPLRRGAGIKNKILQAWAMQKPVVATSISCGGLELRPGENIELADTPQELADSVLALLDDPERRTALGQAGRETVLEHYTWERRAQQMGRVLEEIAGLPVAAS